MFTENGTYDFVGRSRENNGVQGKINGLHYAPNPKNTFSLAQVGETVCLFREKEWYASQNLFILMPLISELSEQYQFVVATINKALYPYQNAYIYPTLPEVKNIKIQLPIKCGQIDFEFMENFVAELESRRVAELESYLLATGLKDYVLTAEEEKALDDFKRLEWKEFDITEIFTVKNTANILSSDIVENSGATPYLCASAENNGVSSYITYNQQYLEEGNCIFIGGKTFVVSYQEKDFYSNDSHNLALYLENSIREKHMQFYIATCLCKSLRHKYSWGDSVSKTKIKKDKILLPTKDGKVDYSIMKTFISAIQKLVIKDVVWYADSKIMATKSVIENTKA